MGIENTGDTGFDMDAAVNELGSDLGLGLEKEVTSDDIGDQEELPLETVEVAPIVDTPVIRQPPKSWSKDYHEHWSKTDPKVQEYIEKREKDFLDGLEQYKGDSQYAKQLRDILTPYKPFLQAQGVDETQAVKYLLNAQYRLSNGTVEERKSAYEQIGRDLGLVQAQAAAAVDPAVSQLQKELNGIKSTLTARQTAEYKSAQDAAAREVETFAADAAHPYFQDVIQDMVILINAGHSLTDAYEKAVWANPLTREKELARIQTESAAKLKSKAKDEADAARKAAGSNVRGQETRKAPTEPKGKFLSDESMREELKAIRDRAH